MSDQDLCSSFETESAWPAWGAPSLPTYISGVDTERFDRLRGAVGLSAEISCGGASSQGLYVLLLSIYRCDALKVFIAFAEVEGAEPSGSLVVASDFFFGLQATSLSDRGSICSSRECNSLGLWVNPHVNSFLY